MSKPIDQELLPCPFCGGVPIVSSFPGLNKIYCSNQPVKCGNRSMFTRDEWQARAAVQPAGGAVPDSVLVDREWLCELQKYVSSFEKQDELRAMLAAATQPVSGEQKPIEMADIVNALESVPGAPMLTSNMCYAIAQAINAHRAQQGEQP